MAAGSYSQGAVSLLFDTWHTGNGMRDCSLILGERFVAQERPEMRDTAGAVSRATEWALSEAG